MSNELMAMPEMSEVPAHILNPEAAKQANADAAAGISTGFAARLKMSAKTFAIVDGNGEETAVKMGDLFEAADGNGYLPAVILRAKREITKTMHLKPYTPGQDGEAPDCFSNDGTMPDASIKTPQCDNCASCELNAWGSGVDQKGEPTKGKKCADNKILAAFIKGQALKVKLPPASLKNFGLYVKQLSVRGIPLGNVKTLLGFDHDSDFSIMTFQFGGFLSEAATEKLSEISASSEVEEIVTDPMTASATPALAAPQAAKTEKKVEAKPEVKPDPVIEIVPDPVVEDDGLGLDTATEVATPEVVASTEGPSDADLAAELGL